MSWLIEKDLTEEHGLRPLTWRDGLLWRRVGATLACAAVWSAIVLWVLSHWHEPGPVTAIIVGMVGLLGGAVAMHEERFEADFARWPRRDDARFIPRPPSRTRRSGRLGRPGCPTSTPPTRRPRGAPSK